MDFVRILADQKEELHAIDFNTICKREAAAQIDLNSDLAQIVIGVRRCGKSTLCHDVLHSSDVKYAYINFDDESLSGLSSAELNEVLKAAYVVYGDFTHLFLDEVQNVDGWHLFVNRLLRKKIRIMVTGSNAKLLSSELSTHLTGRFNQVELFPFSFREKRDYLGRGTQLSTRDRAVLMQDYVDYSIRGGLPETFTMKDPRPYIKTLYDSILFRDIVQRHSVRYAKLFSDVAALTLQNHCREVNFSSLAKQLNVRSVHTVQNYIKYLEQAYLTIPLHKFAFKPVKRLRETKVYAVDMSFVHYFKGVDASGENLGWKLENLVFLKLQSMRLKCDFELSYYKNGREVDFVLIRHGKVCQLIQVAYDISDPKTRAREIKSLLAVSDVLKCRNLLLITASENGIVKDGDKTISIASAPEWLLEPGINAPAPPSA